MFKKLTSPLRGTPFGQLGGNVALYGLPPALAGMIGLLTVPFYTRVFDPVQYGTIALVSTVAGLLASLSVMGLDSAAARYFYDENPRVRASTLSTWLIFNLAVVSVVAMALILASVPIARAATGSADAAPLFVLAAVALPFGVLRLGGQNYLRFQNKAAAAVRFAVVGVLLGALLPITGVFALDLSLVGVFIGQLAAAVLLALIALAITRGQLRFSLFSRPLLKDLLKFGLPLVPAALAVWILSSVDRYMLAWIRGPGEVGVYSLAAAVTGVMAVVVVAFRMAWIPLVLSKLDTLEVESFVTSNFRWAFWAACVLAAGLALVAPPMIRLLAPPEYADSVLAIPYLALSSAVELAFLAYATGAQIAKTSTPAAKAVALGALANLVLNLAFIPLLGYVGAAIGTLISWLLAATVMYRSSQELHPFGFRRIDFFAPFTLATVAGTLAALTYARGAAWFIALPAILPLLVLPLIPRVFKRGTSG